jgi:predicted transcriptional regulator
MQHANGRRDQAIHDLITAVDMLQWGADQYRTARVDYAAYCASTTDVSLSRIAGILGGTQTDARASISRGQQMMMGHLA